MRGLRSAVAGRPRRTSRVIVLLLAGTALSGTTVWAQDGGWTVVSSGTLGVGNNSALGSGGIALRGGTALRLDGVSIRNQVTVSGDPDIVVNGANSMPAYSGGPGTVTNILGANNNASTDVLTLTTTSTYAGITNVGGTAAGSSVTLKGGATNAFGPTSGVAIFSGSVLDLGGKDQTIGSVAGGGTVTSSAAGGVTLTTGDATNTAFSGKIQDGAGTVALTKQGAGTLTLSGANTYTGATTVNAGTLTAGAANAFSVGSQITINTGGTLDLGGFSQTFFAQTFNGLFLAGGTSHTPPPPLSPRRKKF